MPALFYFFMKFKILVLLCLSLAIKSKAQDDIEMLADSANALISISTHLRSTGHVAIYQDYRLEKLVSTQPKTSVSNSKNTKPNLIVTNGFRIRVFSGSKQSVSRNRAQEIHDALKEFDPDLETYILFKSPNWRLVVGNYTTNEEAVSALRKLKKEFPEYGREMFVIKDVIEIKRTYER